MPNAREIIKSVISEHIKITEHIKLTGNIVNDIDAIFNLQNTKVKAAWSMTSVKDLVEKQRQLLQTINLLEEGLNNHFGYEEKVLPLVFGELLMKPILHEHQKISGQIENAKTILINLEGLNPDEISSERLVLLQSINELCQTVENHAHNEETALNMMKKALEENAAYWN